MVDWMSIAAACGLAAAVGLGFVLWEQYEAQRVARASLRRRMSEPVLVEAPVRARRRLDVRSRGRRAA